MATAPERVRPCPRCGELIPFAAERCEGCGVAFGVENPESERVRACLGCGAIVHFDIDPCPQCGAPAKPPDSSDQRVKLCLSCEEMIPYQDLYCARCGELSIELEEDDIPAVIDLEEKVGVVERWPEIFGWTAAVLAIGALGYAGFVVLN